MIGFHVSKKFGGAKGMVAALGNAAKVSERWGISPCAQIYVSGPQSYKPTLGDEEMSKIRELDTTIVIHGAYVDIPWRVDNEDSIRNIKYEARVGAKIGAAGVIIHLGRGANDDAILENTLRALADLPILLWLEINPAKSSPDTFETPAKIRRLFGRIQACEPRPRIGLCIDSAHLWSCGVKISPEWCEEVGGICAEFGLPLMLHLNDSAAKFGGGVDRHAGIGSGGIWGDGKIADFYPILEWARRVCRFIILEREEDGIDEDLSVICKN